MTVNIDDLLAIVKFKVDENSHIKVDSTICKKCIHQACLHTCPVENYKKEGQEIIFSYEGCLECGTCRLVCDADAVDWNYPRGGYGVCFRYG